jgi:hypothetical protein
MTNFTDNELEGCSMDELLFWGFTTEAPALFVMRDRESKFFLRMISTAEPSLKSEARELWKEAHALHLIFSRIWRSTKP